MSPRSRLGQWMLVLSHRLSRLWLCCLCNSPSSEGQKGVLNPDGCSLAARTTRPASPFHPPNLHCRTHKTAFIGFRLQSARCALRRGQKSNQGAYTASLESERRVSHRRDHLCESHRLLIFFWLTALSFSLYIRRFDRTSAHKVHTAPSQVCAPTVDQTA
jgi:hypothetical protein